MVRPARGAPALQATKTTRSPSRRTSDLSAYDLFLRAYALYSTHRTRQALALLEEAIARDPHYGPPWACGAMLPTSGDKLQRPGSGCDPAEGDRLWPAGHRGGRGRPWRSGPRRNGARRS